MPQLRRRAARCMVLVAGPLLAMALIEFVVITSGLAPPPPPPMVLWNSEQDRHLRRESAGFARHETRLWAPVPGALFWGDRINEAGYRGPQYPRERTGRVLRIAVMGDSSTFGHGVPEAKTWGRLLEGALRQHGHDTEVLNFGCIGYSVAQGIVLYEEVARGYSPDIVIASYGCANDIIPVPKGETDEEKIALATQAIPRIRAFLRRYQTVRLLEAWLADDTDEVKVTHRVPLPRFVALLEELDRAVRADGGSLVLVSPPRRYDGERDLPVTRQYTTAIVESAERLDLPLADVRRALRGLDRDRFGDELDDLEVAATSPLFLDPWHPSPKGHAHYAIIVGQTLRDAGLLR